MQKSIPRLLAFHALFAGVVLADEPAPPSPEDSVRQMVKSYEDAFNKHDSNGLAAHWSSEAIYVNRLTGEQVKGKAAIVEQFTTLFKDEPEIKIALRSESIQLLSPSVAIEHGVAEFLLPKAEPTSVSYSAVYIMNSGKWLLDRVTDEANEEPKTHYEKLKPLEWMLGTWVDEDDSTHIETDCNWTKNRNYLTRSFSIMTADGVEMSGMQIVGWDAGESKIRSWTFDSSGGFAEATWALKNGQWHIHNKGVLASGQKASAVNVIKPIDADSFTWQTIERTVGGELLPNVPEVLIVRKQ